MKIIDVEQRSPDWWKCRRGIPTASGFDMIIQPIKMGPSTSQEKYINRLIAERFSTIWPVEGGYVSPEMSHGIETEQTAREVYEMAHGVTVQQVGFCLSDDGRFGCSPDGLVGDDGGIEVKCPLPETHVKYLRDGKLPDDYKTQVHGELLVTGRQWWDFISYSEGLPTFQIRVVRGDFTTLLGEYVKSFCDKLDAAIEQIRERM